MQISGWCGTAHTRPNRWETLCALQSLLPLLREAAADLGSAEMIYWFELADAEIASIIRGRPSDAAGMPALIARSPQGGHPYAEN